MSQPLSLIIVHLVFGTKDGTSSIKSTMRSHLHEYLATVVREADGECYRVGGSVDHVHLTVRLSRSISIDELVKELKRSSSYWVKTQYPTLPKFSWQRGYGCFSIGLEDLPAVNAYIDAQETHHQTHSFREEYLSFLQQHGIAFDERHIFE
ncbi:IS200/IS605-like element ISSen6 family transposase [soil metagenome]